MLRAKLEAARGVERDAPRGLPAVYDELLAGVPEVGRPRTLPGNEHVWHLYVVRVPRRDPVLARLLDATASGRESTTRQPIHLQGALRALGHGRGDFPCAERAAAEVLSLPMFPHITAEQQGRVVDELRRVIA